MGRIKLAVLFLLAGLLAGCGGSGGSAMSAVQCAAPEPLSVGQAPFTGPRISGFMGIEANARVDKDTAELIQEFGSATLTRVEQLPSAVILGGYLSGASGTYDRADAPGFDYPSDKQDRYCIELDPGQRVSAEFFGTDGNARLRLLRASDGAILADSGFDADMTKRVELPDGAGRGNYVIDIQAQDDAGPFRYVLSSSPTGGEQNLIWSEGEFVAGEAVVTLRANGTVAAQSAAPAPGAQMNMDRSLGGSQHKVSMPDMLMAQSQSATDQQRQTIEWVRQLRERDDVLSASPNYLFNAFAAFDSVGEPLYPDQWHYPLINVPQAWQLAIEGGAGVNIAVLDTGLFRNGDQWHEDLAIPACDETNCLDLVDGGLPIDPGSVVGGSVFHGTHVAGTIAALGDNARGGAGIAPSARILPVRVLDPNGSGTLADIITAIDWARGAGADVINLSLGSPSRTSELERAVNQATDAGILIVAAAGNSPTDQLVYPAAFGNVFGVGSVDGAGVRAGYSNIGRSVNLMAPGGDASRDANQDGRADVVISASGNSSGSTYAGLQGTSMATPHVAGVFALMKQLQPGLNTDLVAALLTGGDLTSPPPDGQAGYGRGIIDAVKAVQAASQSALTLLSPTPAVLEFGAESVAAELTLVKVGSTDEGLMLDEVAVRQSAPWLVAGAPQESADGFRVPVSVNRDQLEQGRAYRTELDIRYRSGGQERTLAVPVVVGVESPPAAREAGLHFVLLIDEQSGAVAQTALTSIGGVYQFAFEVVAARGQNSANNQVVAGGSYYLVAGTDLNNDGIICEPGEACAEYPVAGLREKITVELDAGGGARVEDSEGRIIEPDQLVMTTSFSRPLSSQSLPRPGFEGYKLLESDYQPTPRSVAD